MAASTATYACRITDTGVYLAATLGNLGDYVDGVWFVAKHRTDVTAPKIRVVGAIDIAGTGAVDVVFSAMAYRVGVYDCYWECSDGGLFRSLPAAGGQTLEILESLK